MVALKTAKDAAGNALDNNLTETETFIAWDSGKLLEAHRDSGSACRDQFQSNAAMPRIDSGDAAGSLEQQLDCALLHIKGRNRLLTTSRNSRAHRYDAKR